MRVIIGVSDKVGNWEMKNAFTRFALFFMLNYCKFQKVSTDTFIYVSLHPCQGFNADKDEVFFVAFRKKAFCNEISFFST